jgi:hypothetical protein
MQRIELRGLGNPREIREEWKDLQLMGFTMKKMNQIGMERTDEPRNKQYRPLVIQGPK